MPRIVEVPKTPMDRGEAIDYAIETSFNNLVAVVNRHNFNLEPIPYEEIDGAIKMRFETACKEILAAVPPMPIDPTGNSTEEKAA